MIKLRCKQCDRFLKVKVFNTTICQVTCTDRQCKSVNNIKVLFPDATPTQVAYRFPDGETVAVSSEEKELKETNTKLRTQLDEANYYISQLEGIIDGQG